MLMQKPARKLLDAQIDFDIIPTDVFRNREVYHTDLDTEFRVNTQVYRALVIPYAQFISKALVPAIEQLLRLGIPVIFIDGLPKGFYEGKGNIDSIREGCLTASLDRLVEILRQKAVPEILLTPADNRIRYLHYRKESDLYYFINEGTETYRGTVELPQTGALYAYHAWDNVLEEVEKTEADGRSRVAVELEPFQSLILVFDEAGDRAVRKPLAGIGKTGEEIPFDGAWKRSICESTAYPDFGQEKSVPLPDHLAEEEPKFSGWVRYENKIRLHGAARTVLTISDAYEGVEVFVNGVSAGVQVVPTYRFDISGLAKEGDNVIVIEVSTTLERERAAAKNQTMTEKLMRNKVLVPTGITGTVKVYEARWQ